MLGGLLLMAVLVELLTIPEAFVLHGLLQLTANGYRAWLNRAHILWGPTAYFLIGVAASLIALAFFSFTPDRALVLIALGLVPFVSSAVKDHWRPKITQARSAWIAGVVVAGTNLVAGVAGPLLDIFFQQTGLNRKQVVATKAVLVSSGHVAKVGYFLWLSKLTVADTLPSISLLIVGVLATVLGTKVGKRVLDMVSDAFFFRWTERILWSIGAVLLVRGLWALFEGSS